jgi:transposase
MTTRRYLRSLDRWRLVPEQWEQLSDRAVLRFTRFPSIAELHEIAGELQREAEIKANSEYLGKVLHDWQTSDETNSGATT